METPSIKSRSALFLQVIIALLAVGTVSWLLWEPHLEGRNANATTLEIYFKDPFLAYVYVGTAPFFVALHRAFKLFGAVRRSETFSPATLSDLRAIKRCAMAILGFVVGGVLLIIQFGDKDDRPAGFFMSLLIAVATGLIATAAAMGARSLQSRLSRAKAEGR